MVGLPKALSQSFYEILDFHIYKRKIIHDFVVQKKKKDYIYRKKSQWISLWNGQWIQSWALKYP